MSNFEPISIIGGGLAGLTLGIGLRRAGVPVTIWESCSYPRHKVCGEFISGHGQATLARLGLADAVSVAGGISARSGAFFGLRTRTPARPLPEPGLCVSRYVLDVLLANKFRELGGDLQEKASRLTSGLEDGFVLATGRRVESLNGRWRWFGLKAHARNVSLEADLEMFVGKNCYVGICRLPEQEVNVCGLFRWRPPREGGRAAGMELLRGEPGSPLAWRLASAEFDPASFCAVAGLPLNETRVAARAECSIGDALTMTPPVTGNGMSMAFESAEMAIEPLVAWSRREASWEKTKTKIASAYERTFRGRLVWAQRLHSLLFSPLAESVLVGALIRSNFVWRMMFASTR
jgi:2-polyprenyl-6-methoxyphenol hydroxylase-like FAD-dependent oxidoreductase